MITQTYYVSTGRKNAMYTLRCHRDSDNPAVSSALLDLDFYLCTLAATEQKAEEKAREYVERMRIRIGEHDGFRIQFCPYADRAVFERRGKLSVADTQKVETIEAGVFPFGKHKGERIEDAPANYVLFFADKSADTDNDPVMRALSAACMGVALERNYIAQRTEQRAAQAVIDAQSNHIGTVGQRCDFEGDVFMSYEKKQEGVTLYWVTKVRCGQDIVSYVGGKALGERGAHIKFKATVKKHDSFQGVKSTQVARPALISEPVAQ